MRRAFTTKIKPIEQISYVGATKLLKFFEELRRDPKSSKILTLGMITGGPKRGQMHALYWTDVHDNLDQILYVVGDGEKSEGDLAYLRVDLLDSIKMGSLNFDPLIPDCVEKRNLEYQRKVTIKSLPSFNNPIPYCTKEFVERLRRDLPELNQKTKKSSDR